MLVRTSTYLSDYFFGGCRMLAEVRTKFDIYLLLLGIQYNYNEASLFLNSYFTSGSGIFFSSPTNKGSISRYEC